jgi:transposase
MSAPLPNALRARFQKLVGEGLSGRAAALRLKLSPATGARWSLAMRRTGQAKAAPQGHPRGKGKLDPYRCFLIELIDQDGDMTMPELAGALADATGVQAHPDAISRFLRKLGFTYKKDASRDRTASRKGKKTARPMDQAPFASGLGPTGSCCLH